MRFPFVRRGEPEDDARGELDIKRYEPPKPLLRRPAIVGGKECLVCVCVCVCVCVRARVHLEQCHVPLLSLRTHSTCSTRLCTHTHTLSLSR